MYKERYWPITASLVIRECLYSSMGAREPLYAYLALYWGV